MLDGGTASCGEVTSLLSGLYWVASCEEHRWHVIARRSRVEADADLAFHRARPFQP